MSPFGCCDPFTSGESRHRILRIDTALSLTYCAETQAIFAVYKIIYSAVGEKPGARDNSLKQTVGARGFWTSDPWSRTRRATRVSKLFILVGMPLGNA
jgi:hypothetical protein